MAHYRIYDEPGSMYQPGYGQRQQHRSIKMLIAVAIVLVLGVLFHEFRASLPHGSANQAISQDAPDNTRMPKRL